MANQLSSENGADASISPHKASNVYNNALIRQCLLPNLWIYALRIKRVTMSVLSFKIKHIDLQTSVIELPAQIDPKRHLNIKQFHSFPATKKKENILFLRVFL